jgi:predicted transglutaminase-like cysteine proteinase
VSVAYKLLITLLTVGIFYTFSINHKQQTSETSLAINLLFNEALLNKIEEKHGFSTRQRFVDWQNLTIRGKTVSEEEKLRLTNDFFNQNSQFVDDKVLWKAQDYWATPVEFLTKGAGDCEDFSIAKYFTLLEMGIDDSKLRITYVKALDLNQAHMVLTYFENPQSIPLVLDNLSPAIKQAIERTDLEPVYSFNANGLWLAKNKVIGAIVGKPEQLNAWQNLKARMLNSVTEE